MPRYYETAAPDSQRKENNWEQIQDKLCEHPGAHTANSSILGESFGGSNYRNPGELRAYPTIRQPNGPSKTPRTRHRKLWPVMSTGAAVVVGLGVVAYAAHMFLGPGAKATEAHNNTHLAVPQQQNLPVGVTVTDLPDPGINPGNEPQGHMSNVSIDGNWMVVRQPGGNSVLRSVAGQKEMKLSLSDTKIWGETPQGSLILGVVAGAGGVTQSLDPQTGSVKKLPGNTDPSAHWAYAVAESSTGHWAMTVAKSSVGPQPGWVDVDGHKVSSLRLTRQYAWSPDGNTLAAIVFPPGPGGVMKSSTVIQQKLVLYNATTGKSEAPKATEASTTFGKVSQFTSYGTTPIWSPNGKYVVYRLWSNLYVLNVQSGTVAKLPVQDAAFFGFVSGNRIYAVAGAGNQTDVQWFTLKSGTSQSIQVQADSTWHAPQRIDGVVEDGPVLLVGVRGSAAGDVSGSGKILSLAGTHATTVVSKLADYWWYDSVNHHIYFYVQDNTGYLVGRVMTKDVRQLGGQSS